MDLTKRSDEKMNDEVVLEPVKVESFFLAMRNRMDLSEYMYECQGWECFSVKGFRFWARDTGPLSVTVSDVLTGQKVHVGIWPMGIYEAKEKIERNFDSYVAQVKKNLRKKHIGRQAIDRPNNPANAGAEPRGGTEDEIQGMAQEQRRMGAR